MGTKLQYAINILSSLPKNHGDTIQTISAEFWTCSQVKDNNLRTGFGQTKESMDKVFEQQNRESLKKMMLKQEEIFKEQVRELHRLYRVQKMLMAELRNEHRLSSVTSTVAKGEMFAGSDHLKFDTKTLWFDCNYSESPTELKSSYEFYQLIQSRPSTGSNELPNCSRDNLRSNLKFDLEQPAEEGCSTFTNVDLSTNHDPIPDRYTECKMTSSGDDGESDIELTLSIGYNSEKKKQKNQSHTISNLEIGCSKSTTGETISSAAFEKESIEKPKWLFRSLSLNRT